VSNTRRDFISLVGAAALTGTAASRLQALASAPASRPGHPRRHDWDMSWTSKLDKRYRVVLDAPENAEGDPILRAHVWLAQYQEIFGVEAADTSRVLVLRHNAIVMAMKDDFWGRFKSGEETGFKDAAGKGLLVNPIRAARAEVPEPFRQLTLENFVASGGIVLACELAFTHYLLPRYAKAGISEEQARSEILPFVTMQPPGIFAVSVAQDHGCRYVPVS